MLLLVSTICFVYRDCASLKISDEIAYTRAPARMKGLVYASVLFASALSSALLEIINPVMKDPNLIWPFVAAVSFFTPRPNYERD